VIAQGVRPVHRQHSAPLRPARLVRRLVGLHPIGAGQPSVQVDIGTPAAAEGAEPRRLRRAGERPAANRAESWVRLATSVIERANPRPASRRSKAPAPRRAQAAARAERRRRRAPPAPPARRQSRQGAATSLGTAPAAEATPESGAERRKGVRQRRDHHSLSRRPDELRERGVDARAYDLEQA
jgi:hypothetical protein